MWARVILFVAALAVIVEGWQFVARHGGDVYNFDLSGPCAWRTTDHWGWLESKTSDPNARPVRVLFVGNSLTYVNDLPGMLVKAGNADPSAPVRLEVRSVTAPDASLSDLWNEGCGLRRLKADRYDVAVFQEHSFFWFPDSAEQAREAAGRWISAARAAGARPIYFQPWTRPPGESEALADVGEMEAATQMNARLYGADVARIGEAFAEATTTPGAPDLFQSDRHHASEAGTWLAALVFFHSLTGEPAARSTWRPAGVTPDQATILARIADKYG